MIRGALDTGGGTPILPNTAPLFEPPCLPLNVTTILFYPLCLIDNRPMVFRIKYRESHPFALQLTGEIQPPKPAGEGDKASFPPSLQPLESLSRARSRSSSSSVKSATLPWAT